MNCNNEDEMEKVIKYGMDNKGENENFEKSHLIIEMKIYRYDKEKNLLKYGNLFLIRLESEIEKDLNNSNNSIHLKKIEIEDTNNIYIILYFFKFIFMD